MADQARPEAARGLAELNAYYRILRDQGVPFPFASARPFGALLQALSAQKSGLRAIFKASFPKIFAN